MLLRRTPLFYVGLALALGCLWGLDGGIPLRIALAAFVLAGALWLTLSRHETASLAAFYLLTVCAGLVHTLLLASSIMPEDLRRLPDDKLLPTTQWRGVVVEEPVAQVATTTARHALDRTSFVLRVEAWRPTGGRFFAASPKTPWQQASGEVSCTLVGPARDLRCGDRLEFATELAPIPLPLCPGELDYRAYEAEQGVHYRATIPAQNWRCLQTGGGDFWQDLSFRARDWTYARLQLGLEDDPRTADFLAGMLIGYRQEIPLEIEQDFRRTGTLHVFAVSGQNIAELMVVAIVLLQLCGLVRWRWAWTLAPVVLLYCLLTGSPASAIRATVMVLAVLLAWRLGRPLNGLACWSLALIAMLLWNPAILLDPGAQLSFGVVLGLLLLSGPFMRLLQRPFARDPFLPAELMTLGQKREDAFWHFTSALLGATVAATLVSEPITAIAFHQVTPVSVLANLVVVPAAGLITVVGTLGVTVSLLSPTCAGLLNNANWLFAKLLILFVGFLAREPGASLNVADIRTLATPLPTFVVAPIQDSACLLLRTSEQTWLFNTGREIPARGATSHLLQYYGINQLNGLVLAQIGGADNSGAEVIVRAFHPCQLIVPSLRTRSPFEKMLPGIFALLDQPKQTWQRGDHLQLAPDLTVEVLHPDAFSTEPHAEDRALVLLFKAAGQSLLWAGRIGPQVQQELLTTYPDLRADLLVMSPESAPIPAWLKALHVRAWLQFPRRDRQLNISTSTQDERAICPIWPLDQTGAVEIHFAPATSTQPAEALMRPWLALPQNK
jgi:competence protein ComEC